MFLFELNNIVLALVGVVLFILAAKVTVNIIKFLLMISGVVVVAIFCSKLNLIPDIAQYMAIFG